VLGRHSGTVSAGTHPLLCSPGDNSDEPWSNNLPLHIRVLQPRTSPAGKHKTFVLLLACTPPQSSLRCCAGTISAPCWDRSLWYCEAVYIMLMRSLSDGALLGFDQQGLLYNNDALTLTQTRYNVAYEEPRRQTGCQLAYYMDR
jgi:hypothetical protein